MREKLLKILNNEKPFTIRPPQDIKVIMVNCTGYHETPSELEEGLPETAVFNYLNKIFMETGQVVEGRVVDLLRGAHIAGFREDFIASGIKRLVAKGYLTFSDQNGDAGDQLFDTMKMRDLWFRLTPKYKKLLIAIPAIG